MSQRNFKKDAAAKPAAPPAATKQSGPTPKKTTPVKQPQK